MISSRSCDAVWPFAQQATVNHLENLVVTVPSQFKTQGVFQCSHCCQHQRKHGWKNSAWFTSSLVFCSQFLLPNNLSPRRYKPESQNATCLLSLMLWDPGMQFLFSLQFLKEMKEHQCCEAHHFFRNPNSYGFFRPLIFKQPHLKKRWVFFSTMSWNQWPFCQHDQLRNPPLNPPA